MWSSEAGARPSVCLYLPVPGCRSSQVGPSVFLCQPVQGPRSLTLAQASLPAHNLLPFITALSPLTRGPGAPLWVLPTLAWWLVGPDREGELSLFALPSLRSVPGTLGPFALVC